MSSPDNKHLIPIQIADFVDDIPVDENKISQIGQAVIAELFVLGAIVSTDEDEA